jgi:hypothetical protein
MLSGSTRDGSCSSNYNIRSVRRTNNHLEILRSRRLRARPRRLRTEAHSLVQSARLAYFLAVRHFERLVDTATMERKFGVVTIAEARASTRGARNAAERAAD